MKVMIQPSSHKKNGRAISIYLTKMEVCKLVESMTKDDFSHAIVDESEDGVSIYTVSISKFK